MDRYVFSFKGDFEKRKSGNVFLTIHDVGTSFQAMVDFVNHEDMAAQLKDRYFIHLSVCLSVYLYINPALNLLPTIITFVIIKMIIIKIMTKINLII